MAVSPYALCPVTHTFLLSDLASLLSIFSLYPLVLIQAVYCVCSAEQPALKAVCVCVFVPASLSDHVNPLRGPGHLLPALPPFPSLSFTTTPVSQAADMLFHLSVRWRSPTHWPITWPDTGSDSVQDPVTLRVEHRSLPVPMMLSVRSMTEMLRKSGGHVSVVLLKRFSVTSKKKKKTQKER